MESLLDIRRGFFVAGGWMVRPDKTWCSLVARVGLDPSGTSLVDPIGERLISKPEEKAKVLVNYL